MEKINNSFEEWQILYKKAIEKSIENRIQVRIGRKEKTEGDIQNLCYFFPLASWLRKEGKISESSPLTLDIRFHRDGLHEDAKMNDGDFERIGQFMDFINKDSASYFHIMCNGKMVKKRDKQQVSRIFPLCEIDNTEEEAGYLILKKNVLKRVDGLSESQYDFLDLAELYVDYIKRYDNYKGTSDRNFNPDIKYMLRSTVNSYLEQYLDEMDVLSKILWMYILKELIGEKILYTIPENDTDSPVIRENVLTKSRMDAIAYGEAVYQLIENACIHSSGQKAWFGIRIYKAGKNEPIASLVKEIQTRNQLYEKYKSCIFTKKTDEEHENRWNIFNEDFRFYLEFFVLDSAMDQLGMVPKYNQRFESADDAAVSGESIGHIKDLFDIMPDDGSLAKYVEDTTEHYGLSLLRDIVYANRGYLSGKSPNGNSPSQYYYDGSTDEKSEDIYVTEWNALLPISDYWYGEDGKPLRTESANNIFGNQIEDVKKTISYCSGEQIFQGLIERKKKQDIDIVKFNLESVFNNVDRDHLRETILVLHIKDNDGYKMEILSKALFARIVEVNYNEKDEDVIPLHIALILPTVNVAHEFVRLFSIFYRKGKQSGMANIQIALCSHRKEDPETLKVDFILAGKTLSDVMENAKAFAYHHTEDSLEYIPLLAYLTQNKRGQLENKREPVAPVFPYDLFLTDHMEELNGKKPDINTIWKKSLFTSHVSRIINTDLRSGKMGCKLENIHIRLGSKIHIDTFYEVELLFHDTGNVLRFAYLITQRLLYGDNLLHNNRPVLVLGYEQYSSSLILQIEYWLNQNGHFSGVYSAIVYNEPVSGRVIVDRNYDKNHIKEDVTIQPATIQPVIIVPVGTTLSTIYKIRKEACSHLVEFTALKDAEFNWNYCLIVANHDLLNNDAKADVTARYWNPDVIDREKQLITVRQESKNMQAIESRYLIAADAKWYKPEQCEICIRNGEHTRPLIDMKFTDTIPGAIFPLLGKREGTFEKLVKDPAKNRRHMQILRGNLHYAHIHKGYNHFQFIFDFRDLFSQNEEKILKEIKTWKAEPAAFHVLVSPLQMTNSAFIKALIDYVFRGKVRFLRLEFKDTYREEVRAKFSYIIEDFKRLKISDNNAKIYIHYADSSIVMGNTINRARLLVKMLLNQSGVPHEDVELFSKIYLLVNRCSYDTIHYFVRNPAEDLKAFIQLALPSYNTENNLCPACRLTEKYELLAKRSSTQRISTEFARLGEKHGKRTEEEYDNWVRKAIKENHPYLAWLMRWLYVNVSTQSGEVLDFLPSDPKEARKGLGETNRKTKRSNERKEVSKMAEEVKEKINTFFAKFMKKVDSNIDSDEKQYKWLERLNQVCLEDIAGNDDTFLKDAVSLICDQLIATHDYMMLEAMQKAYEEIEKSHKMEADMQYTSVRKIMLKLIADVIIEREDVYLPVKKISDQEVERFLLVRNMEWMISYFKVLSREQISNYYDCRQAIMGIISDVWQMLSRDRFGQHEKKLITEDKSWEKIINVLKKCCYEEFYSKEPQLTASLQYQFQAMLIHRMAHFQSIDMTSIDMVHNMVRSHDRLVKRYFHAFAQKDKSSGVRYLGLPSKDGFILRYLKSVKTATMTTRDDIPCLTMEEKLMKHKQMFSGEHLGENNALSLIMKYLYLENVKILYYGMRELEDLIPLHGENDIDCSVDSFVSNMQNLNREVQKHLQNCYQNMGPNTGDPDVFHQNSLSVFCLFWRESTNVIPVSTDQKKVGIITYMFHYYRLLSHLSEDRQKSFRQDDMPYLYEDLCRCMCGITDSKMCYIAFQSDGDMPEIFTQSGYYLEYITNPHRKILIPQDMELVLRRSCAVWESNNDKKNNDKYQDYMLIPGIAVLSENEKGKEKFLVIRIALKNAKFENSYFYIVLQMEETDDKDGSIGILQKARNILFMREKLQAVLSKDYIVLINFRFDCSYIKPYRKENKEEPIILHISDLHVKEKMDSDIEVIIENVKKHIRDKFKIFKKLNGRKVDLLAVTGDLIDGHDASAPKVEQNYQNAAKLLDGIVQVLWKDDEGYIPHDWKRRVMIITGNHDYASMNQFRAVLKHRTLAAGMPVDGESGTMSKFAYYIDFLIRYLDSPTDRLLNNDLNEIRVYRNLGTKGIKVLMLNSSSMATPRRTNKMGTNVEKVQALISSNLWNHASAESIEAPAEPFRLCLTHHAPNYAPNYFLDNYKMLPGWDREPEKRTINQINKLTDCFIESVKEMFEAKFGSCKNTEEAESGETGQQGKCGECTKQFLEEMKCFKKALEKLQGKPVQMTMQIDTYYKQLLTLVDEEMMKHPLGSKEKVIEEIVGKYEQNELYQQLKSYRSWCKTANGDNNDGYLQSNEQISRLLFDVYECSKMSKTDEDNYGRLIDEIESKGTIDLYLCGHVHAYQEVKEKNILTADMLYRSKGNEVNGYIVTIQPQKGKNKKYTFDRL